VAFWREFAGRIEGGVADAARLDALERARRAIAALGLYLFGAVVLDHLEGRYGTPDRAWIHVGPLVFDGFLAEELFELIGVALLVSALFEEIARRMGRRAAAPLSGRPPSANRAAP
jgi:hypothetical protein